MKEELKNAFNKVKTNVKDAANKISDADREKIQSDVKKGNYRDAGTTVKESFRKEGKV